MQNKTPFNLISYNNNSQNSTSITKITNFSVEKFCNSMGFNKPFFYQFLPYSDKQCSKILNPDDTTRFLKADDLLFILDNLDTFHRKIILDYIASKYDFVLSNKANTKNETSLENIKDLLLSFSSQNGLLIDNFFNFSNDNNIDEFEKAELKKQSYAFRSLLVQFENSL